MRAPSYCVQPTITFGKPECSDGISRLVNDEIWTQCNLARWRFLTMAVFGITAAVIIASVIGASIVLAFAGHKGEDATRTFGLYLGFLAGIFALLAILGLITSVGILATQGNRELAPGGPGRGEFSGDGPRSDEPRGGPRMRDRNRDSSALPSLISGQDREVIQAVSIATEMPLTATEVGDDPGKDAREKPTRNFATRNRVAIGIGGVVGSLALGGFSIFLFFWSANLTGRRPWHKPLPDKKQSQPDNEVRFPADQS